MRGLVGAVVLTLILFFSANMLTPEVEELRINIVGESLYINDSGIGKLKHSPVDNRTVQIENYTLGVDYEAYTNGTVKLTSNSSMNPGQYYSVNYVSVAETYNKTMELLAWLLPVVLFLAILVLIMMEVS